MEHGVNDIFRISTLVEIDGRAWMLTPVYEWVAELMDKAAEDGQLDLFVEKKLAM